MDRKGIVRVLSEISTLLELMGENPFKIRSIIRQPNGKNTISWKMQPGFNYQLQYSDDLISWKSNLPGSLLSTDEEQITNCLLYTSPSPRDRSVSRMPSSA